MELRCRVGNINTTCHKLGNKARNVNKPGGHPGAEREIFPHRREDKPTILAYTATSWRKLLKRPSGWTGNVMTAGDCYRFQLSNPHVDLALTGPANAEQLRENLDALEKGPLSEDEAKWMRAFGHAVHG